MLWGLDGIVNTAESDLLFKPLEPLSKAGIFLVWKKYQTFSKSSQYFLHVLETLFDDKKEEKLDS